MSSPFQQKVLAFNQMYRLPTPASPELAPLIQGTQQFARMNNFKKILGEEMEEFEDVIDMLLRRNSHLGIPDKRDDRLDVLVALADVLGDIQVYCASEMAKYGIDNDAVLAIIMGSNLSKLGADGLPIYDERGKVMKGPNYWKPEPKIRALLSAQMTTAALDQGRPVEANAISPPPYRDHATEALFAGHAELMEPVERAARPSAKPVAAVYVGDQLQGFVPVQLEDKVEVPSMPGEGKSFDVLSLTMGDYPSPSNGGSFDGGGASGDYSSSADCGSSSCD